MIRFAQICVEAAWLSSLQRAVPGVYLYCYKCTIIMTAFQPDNDRNVLRPFCQFSSASNCWIIFVLTGGPLSGASACYPCLASSCLAGYYLSGCGGASAGSCRECPSGSDSNVAGNCFKVSSADLSLNHEWGSLRILPNSVICFLMVYSYRHWLLSFSSADHISMLTKIILNDSFTAGQTHT